MVKKLLSLSDRQSEQIKKDAETNGISFTEMVRRILDQHYEQPKKINPEN